MTRRSLLPVCLFCFNLFCAGTGSAQHHHHEGSRHHGYVRQPEPYVSFPTFSYHGMYGHRHAYRDGGPVIYQPFFPQPVQVVSYTYPVSTVPFTMPGLPLMGPVGLPLAKPIATPSAPAARLKSLDLQARGDQKMRDQKWAEARLAYASAVATAPERAIPHLRLGLCYVVIQRYDQAIREIKRALTLDPSLAKSGDKLDTIFGPDNHLIVNSIVSKLGAWVREDFNNSDRLFLYGVVLHFHSDPRAKEMLEAAMHTKPVGDVSDISLFLENEQDPKDFPKLNSRPDPILIAQPNNDLRFPRVPAPMPDAPVPMP